MTRLSAPSSSLTLERSRLAIKKATSSGSTILFSNALRIKMATRVSNSGGSIAIVSPQPNRDLSLSSTPSISLG